MQYCSCDNPPGGGGRCSNTQAAFCRVIDGECMVMCIDTRNLSREIEIASQTRNLQNVIARFDTLKYRSPLTDRRRRHDRLIIYHDRLNIRRHDRLNIYTERYREDNRLFIEAIRARQMEDTRGNIVRFKLPSKIESEMSELFNSLGY
jgi:hypothetical protein